MHFLKKKKIDTTLEDNIKNLLDFNYILTGKFVTTYTKEDNALWFLIVSSLYVVICSPRWDSGSPSASCCEGADHQRAYDCVDVGLIHDVQVLFL